MVRVAIIGTSMISQQFAEASRRVEGVQLAGVYSRDAERATAVAAELGARRGWSDLDEVLASPDVDAAYVASPNSLHHAQCMAALRAGKHVFVEKPAVPTAAEFEQLLELARAQGLVVFEGMRNAHDPGFALVRELLPQVGTVRRVSFEYAQRSSRYDLVLAGEQVNIFDPALAGGALNDLGVYCVSALVDLFGSPERVSAEQVLVSSGADGSGVALLRYPGFVADVSWSKITASSRASQIEGELGTITIDKIGEPRQVGIQLLGEDPVVHDVEGSDETGAFIGNMHHEIQRFVDLVRGTADAAPDQERTLDTLRLLEAIRVAAER